MGYKVGRPEKYTGLHRNFRVGKNGNVIREAGAVGRSQTQSRGLRRCAAPSSVPRRSAGRHSLEVMCERNHATSRLNISTAPE